MSSHPYPTRYSSTNDMARLPWFEVQNGRLVIADDSVGPIIDIHTHLALSFVKRNSVDLFDSPGPTQHYLSVHAAIDMDVYQNKLIVDDAMKAMKRDLSLGTILGGEMRDTHTTVNIAQDMADFGIVKSIILPIEWPVLSWNSEDYLETAKKCDHLLSMGSVHPKQKRIRERLSIQKAQGAVAIKIHPAVQLIAPDDPRAMEVYRIAAELDLPIFWHCGPVGIETKAQREKCQIKNYWKAVYENPQTTFILGHSGALEHKMGTELARNYDNVWLELASPSLPAVQHIMKHGPADRIMFGTDWPFYHQGIGLAKALIATDGDETLRKMVLRENAQRLFNIDLN